MVDLNSTDKVLKMTEKENKKSKEQEYLNTLQRLQAEFDNYRKRTNKEKLEIIKNAEESLVIELLGVLDNFELSLRYTKDDGIKMIYSDLYSILENRGLKSIDVNCKFDPKIHEALIKETGDEDGNIVEELQKGYMLNDKVIRISKVKVTKKEEC